LELGTGNVGTFLAADATAMPTQPADYRTRSFKFACLIVRLFQELEELPSIPSYIARQILRSGTSVGANLEEAKAAQSRRDLVSKFSIALKEAGETHYWLRLITATHLAPIELTELAQKETNELCAILTASVQRLKKEPR
jgi:four helix bundle protein